MSAGVPATPRSLLGWGASQLTDAGIDGAPAQARWLLGAALGVDASGLARLAGDQLLPIAATQAYAALIARRAAREPLQHLLGSAPFRGLTLAVGPGVFIPRFETESLVQLVLDRLPTSPQRVLDLGSGSGAIALALAVERPCWSVTAVERSVQALAWLRRNVAAVLGQRAESRLRIVQGDFADLALLDAALAGLKGTADAVVSNPPYVPSATAIDPEVGADPPEAVFSGADGLTAIRALLPVAAALLRPGGLLALEHDQSHQAAVLAAVAAAGFCEAQGHLDLPGRARFVTAVAPVERIAP